MLYTIRYESYFGRIYTKTFRTKEECDDFLKKNTRPDYRPGYSPWLPAEQGGEIRYLSEYYEIRQEKDLIGHTVTFFRTPHPDHPLASFIVTDITPKDTMHPSVGDRTVWGYPLPDGDEKEAKPVAYISEKALGAALGNVWHNLAEHNKPWTEALWEGAPQNKAEPSKPAILIMRPDWQMEQIEKSRIRSAREYFIGQEIYGAGGVPISIWYMEKPDEAGVPTTGFRVTWKEKDQEKEAFLPDDKNMARELRAITNGIRQRAEKSRQELLLKESAKPRRTRPSDTIPSLFPEFFEPTQPNTANKNA